MKNYKIKLFIVTILFFVFGANINVYGLDKANVSTDPDTGRLDFDNEIQKPVKPKTPTSVTVKVSDQISNLSSYKETSKANNTYADVNNWTELRDAYKNNSLTYIEITSDFSAPRSNVSVRDLGWRVNSIIIDGGGHTVNMEQAAFSVGSGRTPRGSIFTITNINLIHWQYGVASGNTAAADGVIDTYTGVGGYGYWYFNIDNVMLQGPDGPTGGANRNPRRLLDSEDSDVTLSGNIEVYAKQELMQIGQVNIANNAKVKLQRTQGTTGYSMFYYMDISLNNRADTGFDHGFTMGDGATLEGNELSTYNVNYYPIVYYGFNYMKVGDNVNWSQDGFQMLLDMNRYSGSKQRNRSVTFGQNLNLLATRTVGSSSLYATNSSTITFNAGTSLDLQQWNNSSVVQIDSGSSIKFISPKQLHLSANTFTGTPAGVSLFDVRGSGKLSIDNSQIRTWQGTDSKPVTPEGNRVLKFSKLTVSSSNTTITDTAGNTSSSDIIDWRTRELETIAIDPGTVKLNYINQNGMKIKTVDYPIDKNKNYIGQYIPFKTKEYALKNMPDNYMWAIAKQVPTSAVSDAQSNGDSTSSEDNGDSYGQATIGIVPMEGSEYTYNIYVYGKPNNEIQYQYKDIKSDKFLKSDFVNMGKEKAGTKLSPANYANNIDWFNTYYTYDNVPKGYHYATSSELGEKEQPKTTTVGVESEINTLYVYPEKQTVVVTLENSDGSPLKGQTSPITIDGYSGKEVKYNDLLAGKITENGMIPEEGIFTFDYTDNRGNTIDKKPQNITIKLKHVKVNMTVNQVYKDNNNQLIYTNLASQTVVDNSLNKYLVTIDDNLSDVIDKLKTKDSSEIKIDYDWYSPINSSQDYIVMIDGSKIATSKVPNKDFDLLIVYTGITNFEVSDLNYGEIKTTATDNKMYDNPNTNQNVKITNTDLSFNWDLIVSLDGNIINTNTKENYLGGLLVEKNGEKKFIDKNGIKFSQKSTQSNPLVSSIPMDIKLYQNVGNSVGDYMGNVVWTLQDTPNP